MVAAAAGAKVKISISYPLRFEAGLRLVAAQVRKGTYQRVTSYTHRYIKYHNVPDLMQYVSYPAEARVNGGGELMNLGSHPVEYLYSLFGLPEQVYCRMTNAYWEEYRPFQTEDMATLVCGYDGFTASVIAGRNRGRDASPMVNMLDLNAEEVWMHLDGDSVSVNGRPIDVPPVVMSPSEACVQDLIGAIEEDREPSAGLLTGLAVAEITTAAYQSAGVGRAVDLPLRDERHPLISEDEQVIDGFLD
jgi:predicted dehydrogenase